MKLSAAFLPLILLGCAPDIIFPSPFDQDGAPISGDAAEVSLSRDAALSEVVDGSVDTQVVDTPDSAQPVDAVVLPDAPQAVDTGASDAGVDAVEVSSPDAGPVDAASDTPDVRDVPDVQDVRDVSDTPDVVDVSVIPMDLGPRCEPGQVLCDGLCQQFQNNTTNCGRCGNTCPDRPNAPAACELGTCTLRCNDRFANCDLDVSNGCETSLGTVDNCRACGNRCAFAHATATCSASGECRLGTCLPGFADCDRDPTNGCEADLANDRLNCGRCGVGVNTTSDINNCGGCGIRCSFANAPATCSAGVCVRGTCNAGYADCDGNPANGCEVNTRTDNANCGACGLRVPDGRRCCGGASIPPTDVNNCGGCGIVCPSREQTCRFDACFCPDLVINGVYYPRTACTNPEGGVTCQDLNRYTNHCGACNHRCGTGQTCRNGVCTG